MIQWGEVSRKTHLVFHGGIMANSENEVYPFQSLKAWQKYSIYEVNTALAESPSVVRQC